MQLEFTDKAKNAIQAAYKLAARFNCECIEPEHLLLAVIDESLKPENEVIKAFKYFKVDLFNLIEKIESSFAVVEKPLAENRLPLAKTSEKILKISLLEARLMQSYIFIDIEHILLSYFRNNSAFCDSVLRNDFNLNYENLNTYFKENS